VRGDAVEDEYTFVFVRKLCEKTSKMGCLRALKREKTDKKRQKKGTIQYIIIEKNLRRKNNKKQK